MLDWFKRRQQPDSPVAPPAEERPAEPAPEPESEAPVAVVAPPPPAAAEAPKTVAQSLEKTRGGFFGAVRGLFQTRRELGEEFWDELEERLIQADVGAHTTADLVDALRDQHR